MRNGKFLFACERTGLRAHRFPGGYPLSFPASHRVLIPEALRGLAETVLPTLLDDPRAVALGRPERLRQARGNGVSEIEVAAARVLLDPLSAGSRMTLGDAFEARGLQHCALEQFMAVADLADDPAPALLRAAEALSREGEVDEASAIARMAHEIVGVR